MWSPAPIFTQGLKRPDDFQHIDHFFDLVLHGRAAGCTPSEHNALKLAVGMMAFGPGLDSSALWGAGEFLIFAATHPQRTKEILSERFPDRALDAAAQNAKGVKRG